MVRLGIIVGLVALVFLVAACSSTNQTGTGNVVGSNPGNTQPPPSTSGNGTGTTTNTTTTNTTTTNTTTSMKYVVDITTADTSTGTILVDNNGMTVYTLSADLPDDSMCYNQCATVWPPVYVKGDSAPPSLNVTSGQIGVTERTDGTYQATYNGLPLYYFIQDTQPGDMKGNGINNFGGLWSVVYPNGEYVNTTTTGTGSVNQNITMTNITGIATHASDYGMILVDNNGMTLYAFGPDSTDTSMCYDNCSIAWPPAYLTIDSPPTATNVTTGTIGVMTRRDGTFQATYNGLPLYHFSHDMIPGDTNGEGLDKFGGIWSVVTILPNGSSGGY